MPILNTSFATGITLFLHGQLYIAYSPSIVKASGRRSWYTLCMHENLRKSIRKWPKSHGNEAIPIQSFVSPALFNIKLGGRST